MSPASGRRRTGIAVCHARPRRGRPWPRVGRPLLCRRRGAAGPGACGAHLPVRSPPGPAARRPVPRAAPHARRPQPAARHPPGQRIAQGPHPPGWPPPGSAASRRLPTARRLGRRLRALRRVGDVGRTRDLRTAIRLGGDHAVLPTGLVRVSGSPDGLGGARSARGTGRTRRTGDPRPTPATSPTSAGPGHIRVPGRGGPLGGVSGLEGVGILPPAPPLLQHRPPQRLACRVCRSGCLLAGGSPGRGRLRTGCGCAVGVLGRAFPGLSQGPASLVGRAGCHDDLRRDTRSDSSRSVSSVREDSPEPRIASARARLDWSISAMRSSTVPSVMRRCTCTGWVWPMR